LQHNEAGSLRPQRGQAPNSSSREQALRKRLTDGCCPPSLLGLGLHPYILKGTHGQSGRHAILITGNYPRVCIENERWMSLTELDPGRRRFYRRVAVVLRVPKVSGFETRDFSLLNLPLRPTPVICSSGSPRRPSPRAPKVFQ